MVTQNTTDIRHNLAENLDWRFAERNDAAVVQTLQRGEPVDAVHTLDEAGLLDGFFKFLEVHDILSHWQTFTIAGVYHVFLPAIYFLLLYGTRILFGIASTNALPDLLFSNIAVMTLLGFNAHLVAQGMTQRGAQQRTGERPYVLMDPQTLVDTTCKTAASELERLFNGTLQRLAAQQVFAPRLMVAVDGTRVTTTAKYKGCGCQKMTHRKRDTQGAWVETVELVYGWRLIALIDLVTLIPMAINIVQIQEHEAPHLLALLQQAQVNLAPHSQIATLVVDRAYVDGPTLYEIDQLGITWYLVAKSNMHARRTALALSAEGQVQERFEKVPQGQGRDATVETVRTRLVAVEGIRTWDAYRPPRTEVARLSFAERPALNAVVLKEWRNQPPPAASGPRVILTNGSVNEPWTLVDAYDDRSWIENGLFRNSKQFWTLTRWFPKKTAAGVRAHLTFVMLMVATATAYRLWDQAQSQAMSSAPLHLARPHPPAAADETEAGEPSPPDPLRFAHSDLSGQGVARWRRELRRENRDKLIVFVDEQYGIFDTHEFMVLSGVPLRQLPDHLGTPDEVLRRFGCRSDPNENSNVKEHLSRQDTIP
jgi:hypothetical protein